MSWIQTYSGGRFHYENPQAEDIVIGDIAHALSMLCRYAGHANRFYSVAEHSVLVSLQFDNDDLALIGLLHDATEAYCADLPRPLKELVPAYRDIEDNLWRVVAARFGLPVEIPDEVHEADTRMLITERPQLFNNPLPWPAFEGVKPYQDVTIHGWLPSLGKEIFLQRFKELTQ